MNYFPPKDRSDVVNLLQVARWRFSQINQTADGQAEPKLIEVWAADGFDAVQKVLDWIEERKSEGVAACPHCGKIKQTRFKCCQGGF